MRTRGLLLVLGVVACGDPELGVLVDGERLPVIDMHLHPGDWDAIPPATQEFLASRFPWPIDLRPDKAAMDVLTPAGILGEMDRAGVSVGVLFAIHAPRTVGVFTNDALIADGFSKDDIEELPVGELIERMQAWMTVGR